jgi:RNA polymerase sigma-70 factor, ECF subfamily
MPGPRGGVDCVAPLFARPSRLPSPRRRQRELAVLGKAGRGDPEALSQLYRQYAPGVFSYVRRMLVNEYDAQDVTQQVFVKLATCLDKYDSRRADFSAWMLRVAHNAAVDHLRKQRAALMREPVEADGVVTEGPDPDHVRSLRETFAALSEPQRDVLLLREVVGLTPREVAQRLGKSEAAVNTCHHRARRAAVRQLRSLGLAPAIRGPVAQRAA